MSVTHEARLTWNSLRALLGIAALQYATVAHPNVVIDAAGDHQFNSQGGER
jgi:hypothetical protein